MRDLPQRQRRALAGMVRFARQRSPDVRFHLARSFGTTVYTSTAEGELRFLRGLTVEDIQGLALLGYVNATTDNLSANWTVTGHAIKAFKSASVPWWRRRLPPLRLTTREGRLYLYLFLALLGLGAFVALQLTDPARQVQRYESEVRPLLQRHLELYKAALAENERVYRPLLAASDPSERLRIATPAAATSSNLAAETRQVLESWNAVAPSQEAQRFHALVTDVMKLRYEALAGAATYLEAAAQSAEPDPSLLRAAKERFGNSALLWAHVLAEGFNRGIKMPQ